MGGPEKWQKWGRAKRVLSHFCRAKEIVVFCFEGVPLSLSSSFGRFSL